MSRYGHRDEADISAALFAAILDDEIPLETDPWGLRGDSKMGTTATDSGGGNFTPAPEGNHVARCVRVIDLGTQPGSQKYPNPKHKILIAWELPEECEEYEGVMTPRLVMSRYTLSLHENSALRPHLESWRGRAFTPEELKGFDIKNVLGVPCQVQIVHSEDGKYANVKTISALHPKLRETMPEAFHELIHYQIEDGENEVFNGFSDNLKATIRSAEEWGGTPNDTWGDAPPPDDDDIPFLRNECEGVSGLDHDAPSRRERWMSW